VRLGFSASRRQARQLVNHGHFMVNGRRVNVPSYQLKPGDIISVKETSSAVPVIREATEGTATVPAWLQADYDSLTANVLRLPERDEISAPVQEQLIVELYSK
jgi:small subunit ribosomal protein S4